MANMNLPSAVTPRNLLPLGIKNPIAQAAQQRITTPGTVPTTAPFQLGTSVNSSVAPTPNTPVAPVNNLPGIQDLASGQQSSANDAISNALSMAGQAHQQAVLEHAQKIMGTSGGSVSTAPVNVSGNETQWINKAIKVLQATGIKFPTSAIPGLENIISHESGGNPNAINRWDSNAAAGHPSQGLMQTIPGTFQEWALPGYNKNIDDPVSNIIAGIRYALGRYGLGMIEAGGRKTSTGQYEGY